MKYKAVYDVLNERRQTTPGFCYHDRSGWRAYPQTYMTMQCPLWIIAEDKDHPLLPIFIGYCTDLIPPPPLIEFSLVLGSLP